MAKANYQINSDFSKVKDLASFFRKFCGERNINNETTSVLELILVEAVNNIIEHAYQNQKGLPISAQFEAKHNEVVITLIDEGNLAPDSVYKEKKNMPKCEDLPEGSWGIGLIQSLSDGVEYYNVNGMNILVITKSKAAEEVAAC